MSRFENDPIGLFDRAEWKAVEPPADAGGDLPHVTHEGLLHLGECDLRCYQLSDGRAVIDSDDIHNFLMGLPLS